MTSNFSFGGNYSQFQRQQQGQKLQVTPMEYPVSLFSSWSMTPEDPVTPKKTIAAFTKQMYEEGKLLDVTIKTNDDKEAKANRFILSRSPVFDAMLNQHDTKEAQEKVIEIKDLSHEIVQEMIRFMYTDEIPKIDEMALDLLVAADKYDLIPLFNECNIFLQSNITMDNFADVLMKSDSHQVADLKEKAIKYIIKNHRDVFASADWKALKKENLELAVEVMENCFQVLYEKLPQED